MSYKIPLTKKVKSELLQKYLDFHLRPAPANITDATLVKAIEQIDEQKVSQSTPEPEAGQDEAGSGESTKREADQKKSEQLEKLTAERNRFKRLTGKDAPESATIEQLQEQNDLKEQSIQQTEEKEAKSEAPEIKINYDTQVLIQKGNDKRVVSKLTWENFLKSNPDGWKKVSVKPKEI